MTSNDTGSGRRNFTPDFLTELFRNPLDPGYADAAARRAREGAPTPRARQLSTTLLAVTLVALGFLLVIAYRQTVAEEPARAQARTTLAEQVQRRRAATDQLQDRADDLRAEVAGLRQRELGGAAVAELRDLEAATGLARVRGDGVQVTLADGKTPIDPLTGRRNDDGLITDGDLQKAANELWAGGAEAISINGQRLTATSTIRQAGEAILVDFQPVTAPYAVVAIGPDDLAEKFRKGYAGRFLKQLVKQYGVGFDIKEVDGVTLSAATEQKLRFATPSAPPPPPSAGTASPVPLSTPSEGG